MIRIAQALMLAFAFLAASAFVEAPMRDAFAQAGTKQVRAKEQKAQRPVPAARRTTRQAAPVPQARPPVYEPPSRESSSGGGY